MKIIFSGLQLGVVVALLIGPVFFTILQTSVEKGFWKGALVALGVSLSDTLFVIICYFGLIQFVESLHFKVYMGYVGGGILVLFGFYYLLFKSRKSREDSVQPATERKTYRYVLKGFIINGLSPSVLIFWIGTVSVVSLDFGYTKGLQFFLFFSAALITVLATDVLKAYLAGRLRKLVTPRLMLILNILLGVGMVVFGGRLIFLAYDIGFG